MHTDGHWVWYSDLAHYLDKCDVRLDPGFVAHALANGLERLEVVDLGEAERQFFEQVHM